MFGSARLVASLWVVTDHSGVAGREPPGPSCTVFQVSQGKEGQPEASLGCVVVQSRGEGGDNEACRAPGPGEPRAGLGSGEGLPNERVVDGVDIAGGPGPYRH